MELSRRWSGLRIHRQRAQRQSVLDQDKIGEGLGWRFSAGGRRGTALVIAGVESFLGMGLEERQSLREPELDADFMPLPIMG
jgi:hypothetical protein